VPGWLDTPRGDVDLSCSDHSRQQVERAAMSGPDLNRVDSKRGPPRALRISGSSRSRRRPCTRGPRTLCNLIARGRQKPSQRRQASGSGRKALPGNTFVGVDSASTLPLPGRSSSGPACSGSVIPQGQRALGAHRTGRGAKKHRRAWRCGLLIGVCEALAVGQDTRRGMTERDRVNAVAFVADPRRYSR
jgi:hypothetical protein